MEINIGFVKSRLTVLSFFIGKEGVKTRTFIKCKCSCGGERVLSKNDFIKGNNLSCGCIMKEISTTHGLSNLNEYKIWKSMIQRCYNKKSKYYDYYGGRGISVCDEWKKSFIAFYRDMGLRLQSK